MNLHQVLHEAFKVTMCAGVVLFLLAMSLSGILHDWYTKQVDGD